MAKTRTSMLIDDDLIARAKRIAKTSSASLTVELALRELIRRESLRELAAALGTDDAVTAAPRRRAR
jgi:Arc/MetJ family transcription regulator